MATEDVVRVGEAPSRVGSPRPATLGEVQAALARITERDVVVLRLLLRYPFFRIEDLVAARGLSDNALYHQLQRLAGLGLTDCVQVPTPGSLCALHYLTNLGVYTLAASDGCDAARMATEWNAHEQGLLRLLPRVGQLVTLHQLVNGLHARAHEKTAVAGRPSRVAFSWIRDYAQPFQYRGRPGRCSADAALAWQVTPLVNGKPAGPASWYGLFVLLDRGISDADLITPAARGLLAFRENPGRWSNWRHFPPVLVLVADAHRIEHWRWLSREAAAKMQAAPLVGAISALSSGRDEPLSDPWRRLNWHLLASDEPCGLESLLRPMPPEAVPPGRWITGRCDGPGEQERGDVRSAASPKRGTLPTVVFGNFAGRAERVRVGEAAWRSEGEALALLSLKLSKRHVDLLTFLLEHPLQTIEDIAGLRGLQPSSVVKYVRELRVAGCLDLVDTPRYLYEMRRAMELRAPEHRREVSVKEPLGERWMLSGRGLRVVAASLHFSIHSIALSSAAAYRKKEAQEGAGVGEKEGGPPAELLQRSVVANFKLGGIEHLAGIYAFFADLNRAIERQAEEGQGHLLSGLWWETGVYAERSYFYNDLLANLRPDAMAELRVGGRPLLFWLEFDRASMGTRDLHKKFKAYAAYIQTNRWRRDQTRLPLLLVVATDIDQELRFARIAVQHLVEFPGVVMRTTTLSRVRARGPLAAIWLPVLPPHPASQQGASAPRCVFYQPSAHT